MDYEFSDEQLMLRDAARSWIAERYPADRIAAFADDEDGPGGDPDAYAALGELGWFDAAAAGALETGILLEEAGYGLLPAPLFTSVVLAGGFGADTAVPTTLAWAERDAPVLGDGVNTSLSSEGTVFGSKVLVPDLGLATHAVVTTGSGPRLVELADANVRPRHTIDGLRRLGDLILDGVPSEPLPDRSLLEVRTRILAGAASEAVGLAQKALDLAAEHAKTREQFGRVIGTYQGVSHKIADVYMRTEMARSLAIWANWAIDAGDSHAAVAAAAAKSDACGAAVFACEVAIQVHGGIGFTWDHMLHRYYKRAQWLEAFQGAAPVQRAALAEQLLDA